MGEANTWFEGRKQALIPILVGIVMVFVVRRVLGYPVGTWDIALLAPFFTVVVCIFLLIRGGATFF
jgi:hypothetical protein